MMNKKRGRSDLILKALMLCLVAHQTAGSQPKPERSDNPGAQPSARHNNDQSALDSSKQKLRGRPVSALPSMHMLYTKRRPDRLKWVQNHTAEPILQHLQFHEGFDPRSYSQEGLREVFQQNGWHPAPTFSALKHLNEKGRAGKLLRLEILGQLAKPLGFSMSAAGQYYDRDLSFGEIGCAVSHYKIWQHIAQHGSPSGWAIVLEDDHAAHDMKGLCNFIDKVEAHPKVNGKPSWDLINMHPGASLRYPKMLTPERLRKDFTRVHYSYNTGFYAITVNFAKYLLAAHPEHCIRAVDDITMYACHPNLHPMRQVFGACWPQFKKQRMCFDHNSFDKIGKIPSGEIAESSVAADRNHSVEASQLALLREALGTDERIESPFANLGKP